MEPWDPEKVAHLIALIATGFAARWAYTTQFPPKEEEHTITIVWAAIWSGVIATILKVVHFDLHPLIARFLPQDGALKSAAHIAHASAYDAAALIANLAIFVCLGYVLGRLSVAYEATVRERKMAVGRGFWACVWLFIKTLLSRERGFSSACQYFLKVIADKKWLTVETEKGVYLGYVKVHDSREEDSFYIVLHEARMFCEVTGAFPKDEEWPAIMFKSDDIKSIAVVKET